MSMHTQLIRGLFALPVAALLLVAGLVAPAQAQGSGVERIDRGAARRLERQMEARAGRRALPAWTNSASLSFPPGTP